MEQRNFDNNNFDDDDDYWINKYCFSFTATGSRLLDSYAYSLHSLIHRMYCTVKYI